VHAFATPVVTPPGLFRFRAAISEKDFFPPFLQLREKEPGAGGDRPEYPTLVQPIDPLLDGVGISVILGASVPLFPPV
jgi:hypothetical protein